MSETKSAVVKPKATPDPDKPFSEYTADDWAIWDENHPEEHWIAYKDADGNFVRVPVWYYFTLGL